MTNNHANFTNPAFDRFDEAGRFVHQERVMNRVQPWWGWGSEACPGVLNQMVWNECRNIHENGYYSRKTAP